MNIQQWCCTMWVICLKSVFVLANDWSCGIGVVTKKVSYAMVFMSDFKGVNQCCVEHDQLIDMSVHRQEADRIFCQCLANSGSWYVRNVVKHLYCASVSFYTMVLAGEPRKFYPHGFNQTAVEHGHLNQTGDLISIVSSGYPNYQSVPSNQPQPHQPIRAFRQEFIHQPPAWHWPSIEHEPRHYQRAEFTAEDFHRV
ncbi:hypothetical protein WR25_16054 [Diploscapter pachys]|uniref:Uncharacterized protein n=1 Tax=Diploscapter pachys TaxID=2018661 RepID=A0A2A2KIV6_9BILA|nr:hypothetical protein WR25_16054 [Diploscapter pachys]